MLNNSNNFNNNDFNNQNNDRHNILNCFAEQTQFNQNDGDKSSQKSGMEYTPLVNNNYPYLSSPPPLASKAAKKPKKGFFVGLAAAVVSLSFVFSLAGTALGNALTKEDTPTLTNTPVSDNSSVLQTSAGTGAAMSVEQVAERTANSVVEITTEKLTTGNRMQQLVGSGAGSGVIISADGYIVTNNHVIADASKITVSLKDGTQYTATLVGTDAKTDIAVLNVDAKGLSPATFGSSSTLKVGEDAIAIGNPLGQLGGTVTNGIISALDREITIDGEVMNLLQTNAAINPGNSGGGLFNNKGELIGIVNAKSSGSDVEGLGFAIPVDTAKPVIENLIEYGYVQGRVELGITLLDIDDELTAMMYQVNSLGVYVLKVDSSSNAAAAGLQSGDRITAVNGNAVQSSTQVTAAIDKFSVGDSITLTVVRNGQQGDISFTLQEHQISNAL